MDMQTWPGPQQSGSIDLIYNLKILDINEITRRECAMAQAEWRGNWRPACSQRWIWLVASYISLAGPTQTVPVDEQVKSLVITCYNSHNHRNHQNRSSRHLRMFCSKKACPQPAQPESGGQSLIRRSTVRINSIQYCPTGNEMNAVLLEHLERKN